MPTRQQIENLRMAYAIMWGVPASQIDLGSIRYSQGQATDEKMLTHCSSAGCVAGWLSAHPYFKAQGLLFRHPGWITLGKDLSSASEILFGERYIFDDGYDGIRGKLQALARIRHALLWGANAITSDRYYELARQEEELKA
jgi:hypothetical protein